MQLHVACQRAIAKELWITRVMLSISKTNRIGLDREKANDIFRKLLVDANRDSALKKHGPVRLARTVDDCVL